jgi:hypothetical protein
MFKRNYYYIVAGLADIVPGQNKISTALIEFLDELKELLPNSDYSKIEKILLDIDNLNILNILEDKDKEFVKGGKYSQERILEEIKEPAFDENYLNVFVNAFKEEKSVFENMLSEDQITNLYYDYLINVVDNKFINSYYSFDQNINNINAALVSRKYELKDKNIYIGDNIVTDAVSQSTLKDFGLSGEFPVIEKIINVFETGDDVAREKEADRLRWENLDELNTFNYFTIEVILAYIIKLRMIERWLKLDEKTGKELFGKLIEDLNSSFELPKEFEVVKRRR